MFIKWRYGCSSEKVTQNQNKVGSGGFLLPSFKHFYLDFTDFQRSVVVLRSHELET